MPSLKNIRKRIVSVKNTQKITKAMKMVAAAKLRRASQAVEASRPYSKGMKKIIASIALKTSDFSHPLFVAKETPKKVAVLVFTSNRGLCGGFNSNLLRKLENAIKTDMGTREQIDVDVIGKKGRDFYSSRKRNVSNVYLEYADSFTFADAEKLAQGMVAGFNEGKYDEYYFAFNQFKSALTQIVTIEKLLPISVDAFKGDNAQGDNLVDYIYEPGKIEVLEQALPRYLAQQLYQAHLESVASELGARMTAMDNATRNARDMMGKLTLQYNRARQAAITTELMDIVNGAESIK
ncbi:ATP synthase F1 subunit gamma [bacterium]|nr:ATP synthase F1 subunit gamma [bacterium]